MSPGEAFLEMVIAAMNDAALENKLSQLRVQLIPPGKKNFEVVRIIFVPEKTQFNFPSHAPLGTEMTGN